MLRMRSVAPDVYVANQSVVNVGRDETQFLKEKVLESPRKRIRVCVHTDNADPLHEMFIVFTKDSYIRPSKHLDKDESLHVLEGAGEYIFFDEDGNITDVVPLGEYASGRQFYCRIPAFVYHALTLRSEMMVIHETTEGPFDRGDTVFAPWSPEEGDTVKVQEYVSGLSAAADEMLAGRAGQ